MNVPLMLKTTTTIMTTAVLVAATGCSSTSSSSVGSSDASTSAPGFDCTALRDKQAAANCPKFDPAKYVTDCEDTKSKVPATCKAKADAFANCWFNQPIGCSDAGTIADDTPTACKSLEQDFLTCK